jgi:hypothetical protein
MLHAAACAVLRISGEIHIVGFSEPWVSVRQCKDIRPDRLILGGRLNGDLVGIGTGSEIIAVSWTSFVRRFGASITTARRIDLSASDFSSVSAVIVSPIRKTGVEWSYA